MPINFKRDHSINSKKKPVSSYRLRETKRILNSNELNDVQKCILIVN